jgi:hypothetical protein
MRTAIVLSTITLGALAVACSSGGDTTQATTTTTTHTHTGGSGGTGATGGTGGTEPGCIATLGDGGASCTPPMYPPANHPVVLNSVTADIQDLDGNAAANIKTEVCGTDKCKTGAANGSGHVSVSAGGDTLNAPVLLYGDGIEWVDLFAPLPNPPNVTLGTISAARLPAAASGALIALGQDAVSGDVTLHIDAAAYVEFDQLTYCSPEEESFRAVTLPLDGTATLPGVAVDPGIEMAFGMAPLGTAICPAAKMTVPNLPGWTAGAAVEFLLEGVTASQDWARFGEWTKVSDGAVSADGITVSTSDGQGIPQIGTIGVRLTPGG